MANTPEAKAAAEITKGMPAYRKDMLERIIARANAAYYLPMLQFIADVCSGEEQVAADDTEALKMIGARIGIEIARLEAAKEERR